MEGWDVGRSLAHSEPSVGHVRMPVGAVSLAAVIVVPLLVASAFVLAGAWRTGLIPSVIVGVALALLHLQLVRLARTARAVLGTSHEMQARAVALRAENDMLRSRSAAHAAELTMAQETTAFALAKVVEARDPSTGVHLERVRAYARLLASHLGQMPAHAHAIDAEFIRTIHVSSPLHDIGKVGIADMILLKPDRLTPEETTLMRRHATLGGRTIRAIIRHGGDNRYLEMAYDVAMYHHEHWDGGGYPFGLSGSHIPLPARIVALADVYDALTSKRCYKPAFSHTEARSFILEESGKHFDPDVVAAFMAREADFIRIRDAMSGEHAIQSDDLPELVHFPAPAVAFGSVRTVAARGAA